MLTGITSPTARTTQEIEDEVAKVIETWDRERQIIAYKYLHGQGLRIGASLDHEQRQLRRTRAAGA
jgi:hypothetical protein